MAKLSVRVDGLTKARDTVALLPEAFKAQVRESLEIGGNIILYEANARVPVGFGYAGAGKLKASLGRNTREDGLQVAVGSGDPKAKFVEFPTNDTPAQPFLFPAFKLGARFVRASMRHWAKRARDMAITGNVNAGVASIGNVGGVSFRVKRSNRTRVKK